MEYTNLFYESQYFEDLQTLLDYLELSDEAINELDGNYELEVSLTKEEPIMNFDIEKIVEFFTEERLSENNSDIEFKKIVELLKANINIEQIKLKMPTLHYETGKKQIFTKQELIDYTYEITYAL